MAEKQTVARPYAQAVFALAQEGGSIDAWSAALEFLDLLLQDGELLALVANPGFDNGKVVKIITDIADKRLDPSQLKFIELLLEKGRLELVPQIRTLFEVARSESQGSIEATIVTAVALNPEQLAVFAAALKGRFGREVSLQASVDETIIGGAIIRAGDKVIDGSVAGRLQSLAHQLIH
ncbi:MAG: F0F1 ATP synthase subunit delta [Gammaproteobacteria bacterium]|nr:F0F1 ATP synthase subunit delta [Gammaproteobacteria bacterium]